MFVAEITILCESIKPGCEFRALFYDRATEQFYGGSGATALDAVAWLFDEYLGRAVHGLPVMASRESNTYPGERFGGEHVQLSGLVVRETRAASDTRIDTVGAQYVPSVGCFDAQIQKAKQPAVETKATSKASSAARRAAARKKK